MRMDVRHFPYRNPSQGWTVTSDQCHLRLCTCHLPYNIHQRSSSSKSQKDCARFINVMWSRVSAVKIIRIPNKLMTDLFLVGSCGSVAIVRTVLTGKLNAHSDITCTSITLNLQLPFQRPRWKCETDASISSTILVMFVSPSPFATLYQLWPHLKRRRKHLHRRHLRSHPRTILCISQWQSQVFELTTTSYSAWRKSSLFEKSKSNLSPVNHGSRPSSCELRIINWASW